MSIVLGCAGLCAHGGDEAALWKSTDFTFTTQGRTLSGVISEPTQSEAKALILFVHGYGRTDVRGWDMYVDLRSRFAALGIASVTWDKPGQGRSEGTFDINQPVYSSAQEVLDAIAYARAHQIPGSGKIGIWGISRAGWIAPIALSKDPGIQFWISVSGVTAEDNYFYLLRSNLPYEGSTAAEAEALMQEWKRGYKLFRTGRSYDDYCTATENLRANEYIRRMTGGGHTREHYESEQAKLRSAQGPLSVEPEAGMTIYVHDFDVMLARLNIDILALFGEKDLNVDWRKTRAFYENTIGRNPKASLTVRTFTDGNHNIDVCETGSMREMQDMKTWRKSAGYYDVQIDWLRERVLGER